MVNKASYKEHKPIRTCVICKQKRYKEDFIRIVIMNKNLIFDINQNLQDRGYYICNHNKCLKKINKWCKKNCIRKLID